MWRPAAGLRRCVPGSGAPSLSSALWGGGAMVGGWRWQSSAGMLPPPPAPVCDIGRLAMQNGGQLPMSKIIHQVQPATKQSIIKSGKGLEGYVRQFTDFFEVVIVNGEKRVVVVDRTVDFGTAPTTVETSKPAAAAPAATAAAPKPAVAAAAAVPPPKPSMTFTTKAQPTQTQQQQQQQQQTPPPMAPTSTPAVSPRAAAAPANTARGWGATAPEASSSTAAAAATEASPTSPPPNPQPAEARQAAASSPSTAADKPTSPPSTTDAAPAASSPAQQSPTPSSSALPAKQQPSSSPTVLDEVPTAQNSWGGWGAQSQVPTTADVFELLKFVPVHWTNFGSLTIPPDVKRRHIRVASALAWFSRQPRYFDVRVVAGTIEVRRSVLLHPEAHNLTKEQAEQIVMERIKADKEAGEPVPLKLARAAPTTVKTTPAPAAAVPQSGSAATDAVSKAMLRICPGYFIPAESVCKRSTRRLELADLVDGANRNKAHIDMLHIQSKTARYATSLFRRRTGLDAARWEEDFVKEIAESSSMALLVSCMTLSCAQWDRLHFLYVRLPDDDKVAIGGFDGMVAFLKAHPHVFVVGEYFYKRVDPSDPNFDSTEPQSNAITSTKMLEDNPYHQARDLALVFHYLTPEDQPCSLAHYVDCASPAMKSVLPPRLITIVQAHPELLQYREVSPGTFAVSRTIAEEANAKLLSVEETLAEILKLIPPRGIDASHLMTSLPPQLHAAVVRHHGRDGINDLVAKNVHLFHVVRNPPYVTLFLKKPLKPTAV